uniref:Ribosomal protein S19 n=1 Tax=Coscinodiscus wailesii TaxID=671091 RepID=A0A7T8G4M9_9STRA|nr:ribosomal protein S19 [Coscinodiscus wailesii]QQP21860.1 ribosomal protein S19 [Coscinodiscus wailesii]
MKRSFRKGPYINNKKIITKNSLITSLFLNKTVVLYIGNTFEKVLITKEMIGFKFGEFIKTRKSFNYKKKK